MDPKTSWCIVALPEEDHVVNKVSSEKAAHMTLLFLGEQKEPALAIRIIEAIQHTIKTSFPTKFSLGVERRGTLGQDQADVLFFYKDETGQIQDFRSLLLKNDDIKQAYDSTFQYPEWTPHLTLGYPNRPAKPIPNDSGSISWITFDRIALWLEDSDGPEIRLSSHDPVAMPLEHADRVEKLILRGREALSETDDFLAHYGVKGMKWGVRKASGSSEKESRKEYRARIKSEREAFYNKKMQKIASKAVSDGDDVLIKTMYQGDTYQTVTTGSEFVKQLSRGQAFDVRMTEVYATLNSDGNYQTTGDRNVYKKSKRIK